VLNDSFSTGNYSEFLRFFKARTVFDNADDEDDVHIDESDVHIDEDDTDEDDTTPTPRTINKWSASVRAMLMHTGGRDCIIPGYGPISFWELLTSDLHRVG
jgi:hypothetical protein